MHTFKNFKNFAEAEIDLSKPMTILIGRNGSGKSNIIEGIELLSELLKGRDLHEIFDVGRDGDFEIRGGLNSCGRQGYSSFEIGFKDTVFFEQKEQKINYQITVNFEPTLQINKQAMVDGKNLLDQIPVLNNYSDNDALLLMALIAGLGLFSSENKNISQLGIGVLLLTAFSAINKNQTKSYKEQLDPELLLKKYTDTFVFDIYPRAMREYSQIGENQLSKNGAKLSSVLFYLKNNAPDTLEKILNRIKQLPEEEFESFEFITTSDNSDVLFALKYPNGEQISAKLLSDGTLRALAILTALETVPEGSRILIEEIDNGVHASRVNILIEAIWEASHRRHLKTLMTTHNPATLDSLKDEQLACVVVCHYDIESQSAKLTPLLELPRADAFLEMEGLGSAVTHNIIEQHLIPDYEKQQRKNTLAWLESLND